MFTDSISTRTFCPGRFGTNAVAEDVPLPEFVTTTGVTVKLPTLLYAVIVMVLPLTLALNPVVSQFPVSVVVQLLIAVRIFDATVLVVPLAEVFPLMIRSPLTVILATDQLEAVLMVSVAVLVEPPAARKLQYSIPVNKLPQLAAGSTCTA